MTVSALHGGRRIRSIDLRHKGGRVSGLDASAIFVFIGAEPHADCLPESVARDELCYRLTGAEALLSGHWPLKDREPAPLETSLPPVLAGGDVCAAVRSGWSSRSATDRLPSPAPTGSAGHTDPAAPPQVDPPISGSPNQLRQTVNKHASLTYQG